MGTCATYRAALVTVSNATAQFADAMEQCSGLKGPTYEAGTRLQAGSGLHHLIGNHMPKLWTRTSRNLYGNTLKPIALSLPKDPCHMSEH
ncbi:hypothetical protein DFH05DRAFT_337008 [Lentinula detonsa]|uniref:Uncharacterized protein n=1 Tax=Lentinula detonsa TaxID=2804962 RepID=A0A9W8NVA1_9AGAR|nr:hypothetical protein DFH05DRAFT_337008 [Lentinula detonsa]